MSDEKRERLQIDVLSESAGEEHVQRVLNAARAELDLQKARARRDRFKILWAIPAAAAVATFAGWFVIKQNKTNNFALDDLELAEQLSEGEENMDLLALADEDWELFENWEDLEEDIDSEDV